MEITSVLLIINSLLLLAVLGLIYYFFKNKSGMPGADNQQLVALSTDLEKMIDRLEKSWRAENSANRDESRKSARETREELSKSAHQTREELNNSLKNFTDSLEKRFSTLGAQVETRLDKIQKDNTVQLDKMRQTVDEKLSTTLEKRLNSSFNLVQETLNRVQKELGSMQQLATGVGDLKKVLTNVKTRGTWGEIQLGALLEEVFTPNQYQKNVKTKKNSADRVEFAILIPNHDDPKNPTYLPIDAKFPIEDYQRLIDAQEHSDLSAIESARKALVARIKSEAKKIADKYLDPPQTTDFAFMYLPTEGLFAEVAQSPGLIEQLQREYRVTVAGPTNILAVLNSLQTTFRTIMIQERSTEVWQLLEQIKTQFGKFGEILEKTQKKLQEASDTIDAANRKTRTINRKLEKVALPEGLESAPALSLLPDED